MRLPWRWGPFILTNSTTYFYRCRSSYLTLGSPLGLGFNDQRAWASGRTDREADPAESSIGDREGLLELVGTEDCHQGRMG